MSGPFNTWSSSLFFSKSLYPNLADGPSILDSMNSLCSKSLELDLFIFSKSLYVSSF
ncbi:hypothetical protein HanIR_Chr02g0062191 [Helianthus annuus]|nr:hypothetical protein HanIR_Chr02g0062191 [Helianthus annuus]